MIWRKSIFSSDQASAWTKPGREIFATEPVPTTTVEAVLAEGRSKSTVSASPR
jgi:hypothetical protein